MNKKILTFFIIAFFTSGYVYGQTVKLGARGGFAVPNIISTGNNPLSKGYGSRFAGGGGLFTELGICGNLSFRFGVEYSSQGGKRNGVQGMSTGQMITDIATRMGSSLPDDMRQALGMASEFLPPVFYAKVNNTAKFDYLMIPLSVQTELFPNVLKESPWRFYVNAGPFVSFLLSGEQVSKGSSKLYSSAEMTSTLFDMFPEYIRNIIESSAPEIAAVMTNEVEFGTSNITGEIRPVNAGLQGNVGIARLCGKNRLFLEVGGNYGFIRLQKNKANGSNKIGAMTVMMGYSFALK